MFVKLALFCLVAVFFSTPSEAQYIYSPAYTAAVYSPYVYPSYGFASAYPAVYAWGSNKGEASSAPSTGKLTNNQ